MSGAIFKPYSQLPSIPEGDRLCLLFYCINYAVNWGVSPLDAFVSPILMLTDGCGYCGGDPGWEIDGCDDDGNAIFDEYGTRLFRCWASSDLSDIKPDSAYYSLEEVRYFIKVALQNIAMQHPERAAEAARVIEHYGL